MIIPGFINIKFVQDDGYLTPSMQLYESGLNQAMQGALSNNGWTVPALPTTQINTASGSVPNGLAVNGINQTGMPVGTIWFNTTLGKLQVKTSLLPAPTGTIETLGSTVGGDEFLIT